MNRRQVIGFSWLLAGLAMAAIPATASNDFADTGQARAAGAVQAALQAELSGDKAQRDALLEKALAETPDLAAARWQRGQVLVDGKWLTSEEIAIRAQADERLIGYRELRTAAGDNAADQRRLADWCRDHGLSEEERVHLTKLLTYDYKNSEVLSRLNLQEVDGELLTTTQRAAKQAKNSVQSAALKGNHSDLVEIRTKLASHSSEQQKLARRHLAEACDANSAPAIPEVFLAANPSVAREAITALANVRSQSATKALLRFAVQSNSDEVRLAAADALSARRFQYFLPILLSGLRAPVASTIEVRLDGDVAKIEHEVTRPSSGREEHEVASVNVPLTTPNPNYRFFIESAVRQVKDEAETTKKSINKINLASKQRNERIFTALNRVTSANQPADIQAWHDWWKRYTESYADNHYVVTERHEYAYNIPYVPPTMPYGPDWKPASQYQSPAPPPPPPGTHHSCFAKGTTVWTLTGPMAIEDVLPGDRLLAQDPDSGEVAYKPVLALRRGTPLPMLKITVGGKSVVATLGHEFWVNGKGWRMAKELKVGDALHCTDGARKIEALEAQPDQNTYNFVVADFHTYFVGENRVISHDINPSDYTAAVVPGLRIETEAAINQLR